MNPNDQADGFFGIENHNCPRCVGLAECCCTLASLYGEQPYKKPHVPHEKDLYELTHGALHFRLAKGFRLLLGAER